MRKILLLIAIIFLLFGCDSDHSFTWKNATAQPIVVEAQTSQGFIRFTLNDSTPAETRQMLHNWFGSIQINEATLIQQQVRADNRSALTWTLGFLFGICVCVCIILGEIAYLKGGKHNETN
jgi:hypothetical protein